MQRRIILTIVPILLLAWGTSTAGAAGQVPVSARWSVRPLSEVDLHAAPAVDRDFLAGEDLERDQQGLPYRFALPQEVSLDPSNSGTWETLPSGRSLWRLRIANPGALSLNLGFTRFWLPADAELFVHAPGAGGEVLAYDAQDNADHGQLWTPVLLTDELVVELEVDPALRWMVDLQLGSIGRGYRFFGEDDAAKSGTCNIDVVCPEGDDWRNEIDTVGLISRLGSTLCSGFMINNTTNDAKPLFYTAFHCGVTAAAAPTLVVYWNFQSPNCGQQGGGVKTDVQNGSTLLAASQASDFTLVELDDDPDPDWGVKFAGWNRSSADPTSGVTIHHPSIDEKSISFENDPLTTTTYFGDESPGDGTHLRVLDWDAGTTEGGSSGSPLFDQNHLVVGSLHGGRAACGNDLEDWYGRLSVAWTGEGTPSTRLSDWLDPVGTGAVTLGLLDPLGPSFAVSPASGLDASGVAGGAIEPATATYTLTNTGPIPAPFEVSVPVAWLAAVPDAGTIPVGGQVEVSLGFTQEAGGLAAGTHRAEVEFVNTALASGSVTREVTLVVLSNAPRLVGPVPNPFTFETQVRFTLGGAASMRARIYDVRGRLVRDLGTMAGQAGDNYWTWDGKNDQGGRAPSGVYGFVMTGLGQELRTNIVHIH
jgi:hypothetical protein